MPTYNIKAEKTTNHDVFHVTPTDDSGKQACLIGFPYYKPKLQSKMKKFTKWCDKLMFKSEDAQRPYLVDSGNTSACKGRFRWGCVDIKFYFQFSAGNCSHKC